MSEDDVRIAKKVLNDVFIKRIRAKTKAELDERLFLVHTLLTEILMGTAIDGGLAQSWEQQIEEIEERINDLRNAIAQAR